MRGITEIEEIFEGEKAQELEFLATVLTAFRGHLGAPSRALSLLSFLVIFEMRCLAIVMYFSFTSIPVKRLFSFNATRAVVPLPMNGSRMMPGSKPLLQLQFL